MKNRVLYAAILVVVALVSTRNVKAGGFTVTNKTDVPVLIQHIDSWCNIWTLDKQALLTHCDDYRANIYQIEILPGNSFQIDKPFVWYDVSILAPARLAFKGLDGKLYDMIHVPVQQHWKVDIVRK